MLYYISKYKIDSNRLKKCSLEFCFNYLKDKEVICIDIETSKHLELGKYETEIYQGGLDPYLSRIIMFQIGTLKHQFAIDVRDFTKEELSDIFSLINWRRDKLIVGHNIKFEGVHLRHNYNIRLDNVYDTMMAEISLYNGVQGSVSLAALAEKYLGVKKKKTDYTLFDEPFKIKSNDDYFANNPDLSEETITPFEEVSNAEIDKSIRNKFINLTDQPFTEEQIIYGLEDIIYPLRIKQEQDKGHYLLGFHFHNEKNIKLESIYTQVGADMEYNGLPFSKEEWLSLEELNNNLYQKRLNLLNEYVIKNYEQFTLHTLFGSECSIDWKSPKQVIGFFKYFNACPKERSKQTKKMEYSVAASALLPTLPNKLRDKYGKDTDVEITDIDTLKLAYLLLRKAQMNITTYGKDFLRYVHPITGRLHPKYRLHLISSRTATTAPNLLAIPTTHRKAFRVSDDNRVLVVNDYSSQESRVIADKSGDPLLISFFNNGHEVFRDDFHSYTSALVYKTRNPDSTLKIVPKELEDGVDNPEFTEEMAKMRQDTKRVNFGLAYGITEYSLAKDIGISISESRSLINGYFETFPDLSKFIKSSQEAALENKYVVFEPKYKAIYIEPNMDEITKKEEECKSYFFNDYYKNLTKKEREVYKQELYRDKPYIKEWFTEIGLRKSKLANRGCNLKIQGTSGKQSKVAQINMRKYSINNPHLGWEICLLLHDESVSECNIESADIVAKIQSDCMVKAASIFCPSVKFATSGKVSKIWTH